MWLRRLFVVSIGVRELRDGLSRHLARVRAGATLTVTDHGRPVARIVPVNGPNALERLTAEGRVRSPAASGRGRPKPVRASGMVSDLLDEQRR
jgi:prevent-host-death family protein